MVIKIALGALVLVCVSGPMVQTLRFRRFGRGSPWKVPVAPTREGAGWALAALGLIALLGQGGLVIADHPGYGWIPALNWPDWARLAGLAVGFGGAALAFGSQMAMGPSWRVGTDPDMPRDLVREGIFRYTRNPIYLGFLAQVAGGAILMPTAVSGLSVAAAYLGVRLIVASEEAFLAATYGRSYDEYAARTGRFLPRLGGK